MGDDGAPPEGDSGMTMIKVSCPATPLQLEGPVYAALDAPPQAFRGTDHDEAMSFGDVIAARAVIAEHLTRLRIPSVTSVKGPFR